MKKTLVYLFLAMLLGTSCQRSTEELRIVQFENHLGKEKSTVLSKKVIDFEVFLTNNFSDNSVTEAYKKYLEIIVREENKNTNWNYAGTNRKEINSKFESSGLREEIFLKPDSVWLDNES